MFLRSKKPIQTCFARCVGCGLDLPSRVGSEDGTTCTDTDFVRYDCGNCNTQSTWDFGTPAPTLISAEQIRYWALEEDVDGIWRVVEHCG